MIILPFCDEPPCLHQDRICNIAVRWSDQRETWFGGTSGWTICQNQNVKQWSYTILFLKQQKHLLDYSNFLQTQLLVFVRSPQCQLWSDLVTNAPTIPCFPPFLKCRHERIVLCVSGYKSFQSSKHLVWINMLDKNGVGLNFLLWERTNTWGQKFRQ